MEIKQEVSPGHQVFQNIVKAFEKTGSVVPVLSKRPEPTRKRQETKKHHPIRSNLESIHGTNNIRFQHQRSEVRSTTSERVSFNILEEMARKKHEGRLLKYKTSRERMALTILIERRTRVELIKCSRLRGVSRKSTGQFRNERRETERIARELVTNCDQRFNFLINRVVPAWNKLPEDVTNSELTL